MKENKIKKIPAPAENEKRREETPRPLSFGEFFRKYPRYARGSLLESPAFRNIFDFVTGREKIIIKAATNDDRPAICALFPEIEKFHDPRNGIDLESDLFLRQLIGAIVGEILKRRGFVKFASRNISAKLSKYFKAGAVYKPGGLVEKKGGRVNMAPLPVPDRKTQRENALEFARSEDLEKKISTLITCGPDMMIHDNYYRALSFGRDLTEFSGSGAMYSTLLESVLDGSVYFCAAQIAVELESRYPGIAAASGLRFAPGMLWRNSADPDKHFFFIDLVENALERMHEKGTCEKRTLCDWFFPTLTFRYDGEEYFTDSSERPVNLYRKAGARVRFQPVRMPDDDRVCRSEVFTHEFKSALDAFNDEAVAGMMKIIRNAAATIAGAPAPPLMTPHQIAMTLAESHSDAGRNFFVRIAEKIFFRQVFIGTTRFGDLDAIIASGLSMKHITSLSFDCTDETDASIEAAGKFLPLASFDRVAAARIDNTEI